MGNPSRNWPVKPLTRSWPTCSMWEMKTWLIWVAQYRNNLLPSSRLIYSYIINTLLYLLPLKIPICMFLVPITKLNCLLLIMAFAWELGFSHFSPWTSPLIPVNKSTSVQFKEITNKYASKDHVKHANKGRRPRKGDKTVGGIVVNWRVSVTLVSNSEEMDTVEMWANDVRLSVIIKEARIPDFYKNFLIKNIEFHW